MNKYEITVSDIYEKGKNKKVLIESVDVYSAHKKGLKYSNALREEISKIMHGEKLVYSFRNGFSEE